jgi:hypothetical protein
MNKYFVEAIVAASLTASAPVFGQTAMNSSLDSLPAFAPPIVPFVHGSFPSSSRASDARSRAIAAIENKEYARAEFILGTAPGIGYDSRVKFLAGIASAGAGQLVVARRHFAKAARIDRNFFGAQIAPAITNARLGDIKGKQKVLDYLLSRQAHCNSTCVRSVEIDHAVEVVRRVAS